MIPAALAASDGGAMIPAACLADAAFEWWLAGDLLRSRWLLRGMLMLTWNSVGVKSRVDYVYMRYITQIYLFIYTVRRHLFWLHIW